MTPEYLPQTPAGRMARLTEECGEVLQIVGKIGRFGLDSRHPTTAFAKPNSELLLAEIADLEHALYAVKQDIYAHQRTTALAYYGGDTVTEPKP